MKFRAQETGCPPASFADARGNLCPRPALCRANIATILIRGGLLVAIAHNSQSRRFSNESPGHGGAGQKPIQFP